MLGPDGGVAEREDYRVVVLKRQLAESVRRLKPKLLEAAVEEVVDVVTKPKHHLPGAT